MPAFNIAQNQQLAQPVSSFFQGKAMAIAEKNQARKMEIEEERLAMEERRLGQADRGLDLEEDRLAASVLKDQRAAQDKLYEDARTQTRDNIIDPERREVQQQLHKAHRANPTQETSQAIFQDMQLHAPAVLKRMGGPAALDKDGNGIIDPEISMGVIRQIEWVNQMPTEDQREYAEASFAASDPESPKHKWGKNFIAKADKDAKETTQPLVKVYDPDSPTGFSYKSREEALGHAAPAQGGMEMEMGPDGTMTVKVGGNLPIGAQTDAIKTLKPLQETYANIESMQALVDPATVQRVLTIPGRLGTVWDILDEKLTGTLSSENKRKLDEATDFMSRSTKVYSDYLFGRGGKNLTATEKKTVKGMMPDSGESWFTMDFQSPTQFNRALKNLKEYTEIAMVREYIKATNTTAESMTPEAMENTFPARSETYKTLRGKMFRDMDRDAATWIDPVDMGDEELEIYYNWVTSKGKQ